MGAMSGKDLTEKDRRMWQAVTRHVRPLGAPANRSRPGTPQMPAASPLHAPSVRRGYPTGSGPVNRGSERKIRQGKQQVAASFDLHGHTQDSAWRVLPQFLSRERARGSRCVIVITGKGRQGEGVLRRNFLHWLELPEAHALVSGYAPAHPRHGGSGAWYVFLRK